MKQQLEDAESLIRYAACVGTEIDSATRQTVFSARANLEAGWTAEAANDFLAALTKLSQKLYPVSGDSLLKCVVNKEAVQTVRQFRWVALSMFVIILPFSIAAFVATSTCSAIRSDIEAANGLAVTLVHDISAPAKEQALEVAAQPVDLGKLRNLQQLAVMIRDIEMRAQSLSSFGIDSFERVTFELPIQVTNTNFTQSAVDAIGGYQRVRASARSVQERVSTMFGALSACLLPTLYAVLGACAYFLRLFEAQYKARTFTGREKTNARFLIAAIGDLVVGLFGNFGAGHEPGLSPLAVAFLAGYGVNVFFVFLDGLLQAFGRSNAESSDSAQRVLKS